MDLKEILDPKSRYIFFTSGHHSFAYQIVYVEKNYLYFSTSTPLKVSLDGGHVMAQDNKGIINFSNPVVESLKDQVQQKLGLILYRVDFSQTHHSISNRRRSPRFKFDDFIPISFKVYGENLVAQLINISEGGLRMCADTDIKKNVLCQLELKFPMKKDEFRFKTNGVVVYAEREPNSKKTMIGINFVTPEFKTEQDEQDYFQGLAKLKSFIS